MQIYKYFQLYKMPIVIFNCTNFELFAYNRLFILLIFWFAIKAKTLNYFSNHLKLFSIAQVILIFYTIVVMICSNYIQIKEKAIETLA